MPWDITPADFDAYLRTLRFGFHKWDTFACGSLRILPESIVLTPQEHSEIVSTAERLAAILRELERKVRRDRSLLQRLGIPRPVAELISRERESQSQLARYDFFPRPDGGWSVSEFNEDVPGGFNEIVAAESLLARHHREVRFVDRFADHFVRAIGNRGGRIALLYATGYSEDLQHMLVLRDLLEKGGCETVLGSPRHLRHRFGRFSVGGSAISGVVRFYPGEWFGLLENRRAWSAAVRRLPMMNPLCRLIAQSKSVFALWDLPGMVEASDLDFLHGVAPRTEFFRPEAAATLAENPARWVLKQNFGRMGENVVMGSLVRPEEWQEALRHACTRPGDYVAQECFATRPLQFADEVMYPAIGAFLINGRFAGYYSRVAPTPFLTHQATYVPTVVSSEAGAPVDSADSHTAHDCAV